jgi:hypothetical protein
MQFYEPFNYLMKAEPKNLFFFLNKFSFSECLTQVSEPGLGHGRENLPGLEREL